MNNRNLEKRIESNLEALYQKYVLRIKKLKNCENRKLGASEAFGMIAGIAGVGAALGSPVPGLGNAIGAAAGAVVGSIAAASVAIDCSRKNKKLANANNVFEALNQDGMNYKKIFSAAAKRITEERADRLANCSRKDLAIGAKLLARDAMAGLKKYYKDNLAAGKREIIQSLCDGARNGESKKASQKRLTYKQGLFAAPTDKKIATELDEVYLSKKYA